MNEFEKELAERIPRIRKACGAFLYRLEPKMRCAGTRGTMPIFILVGRALYDFAGWGPAKITGTITFAGQTREVVDLPLAITVGMELKDTKQRHPSMRIVGADGSGGGIQAHQLEALAAVHRDGGIARLVWNNGGVVGVLDGDELAHVFHTYGVSLQVEKMGKTPAKGARSIPWSLFRQIDWNDHPESVIVPPKKEPTLKEALAAKRAKARKQIEEAEQEQREEEDAGVYADSELDE